jgi:arogenate dehydrogenase (NADP+)
MKALVIGYGRFGALWCRILQNQFEVIVSDRSAERIAKAQQDGFQVYSKQTLPQVDIVFFGVPMSEFEYALGSFLQENTLSHLPIIADLLSVKVYPQRIFARLLPPRQKALLLHPLFGPDAVRELGSWSELPLMFDQLNLSDAEAKQWKEIFMELGLNVLTMSCEEHDRKAAWSQGVTHYIGRILDRMNVVSTEIDTVGAKKLQEIKSQVCNDTWELFQDLQAKNPYTREMRVALDSAQQSLLNQLIPNRRFQDKLVIGIQGGRGSFNETATLSYLQRSGISDYEIVYLYTSEAVLSSLHRGDTDRGVFAIHNSIGGVVDESLKAISRHNFDVVEEFAIPITHSLMCRQEASLEDLTEVMAHPQVFKQCAGNIKRQFPHLALRSGQGDFIDTARAAEHLATGNLPASTGIMGNPAMAEIYGLKIVADNLQDLDNNLTSFLLVERRSEIWVK